jgi:hypothetical protein
MPPCNVLTISPLSELAVRADHDQVLRGIRRSQRSSADSREQGNDGYEKGRPDNEEGCGPCNHHDIPGHATKQRKKPWVLGPGLWLSFQKGGQVRTELRPFREATWPPASP